MKIAIFGTSNSVIPEGWTKGLKNSLADVADITNFSIGGSCVAVHILQALRRAGDSYDVIFMDSLPNDIDHSMNCCDLDALKHYIEDTYRILRPRTKKMVTVLFPSVHQVLKRDSLAIYRHHRKMAEKYTSELIDLYDILPEKKYERTFRPGQYHHLLDDVSCHIGHAFGESLKLKYTNDLKYKEKHQERFNHQPYMVATNQVMGFKTSVNANSIMKEHIALCQSVPLSLFKGKELIGLLHWSHDVKGIVLKSGGRIDESVFPLESNGYLTMDVLHTPYLIRGDESLEARCGEIGFIALLLKTHCHGYDDFNSYAPSPYRLYGSDIASSIKTFIELRIE